MEVQCVNRPQQFAVLIKYLTFSELSLYNLPHHLPDKQQVRIQQNFEMFNNIPKIVTWNAPVNKSNFDKVILWQLSQVSWSSKAFSEETSIAKEF